jgi:DNA-binding response OmpR family regulator
MTMPKSVLEKTGPVKSPERYYRINQKRILVVEDQSAISGLLSECLRDWGFDVLMASNGREGLEVLNTHTVDGIFLDLEMPIMDGWTMLDELRWRGYQTPVIVMSGGVDPRALRNMLEEGAQGFLVKPFTVESLKLQCQRLLGNNQNFVSGQPRMPAESLAVCPSEGGWSST